MKFVGIVGTNAKFSYNRLLLKFMARHFNKEDEIEVLELTDVPMFNETADDLAPKAVQYLEKKILESDGVIIGTPEHNHSLPSALKSVIEWLSFKVHPFNDKPVMIVGASYSEQGSSRSQLHLRQVLDSPGVGAVVMPGYEFLLGNAHKAFDGENNLKDEGTVQFLETCFKKFKKFTEVATILSLPEDVTFEPGEYNVTAAGHNGSLPMIVSFSTNRIESIDIDTSGETEGIADIVFTRIPEEIIDGQTLNVDAVSGASVTSKGIIDGVSEAVKLADADPESLKRPAKKAKQTKAESVEKEADVVVVGSGGAGLAAAVSAIDEGSSVLILEKFPMIGGNTVRTGGQINAADPSWQNNFNAIHGELATLKKIYNLEETEIAPEYRENFNMLKKELESYFNDIEQKGENYLFDSDHLHTIQTYLGGKRKDLSGNEIYSNYQLIRYLTTHALETINWLKEKGVSFDEKEVKEPVGALWRRAREPKQSEGFGFIEPLKNYIKAHDGEIITEAKANSLVIQNGNVTSIKATDKNNQDMTIHAKKGIILATGGFGANIKKIQKYDEYWGDLPENLPTTNSPALTGDGIEMGQAIGAETVGMGFVQLMPSADPITGNIFSGIDCPPSDFIFVNKEGKRFVDEYASRDTLAQSLFDQGGVIYNISDAEIAKTRFNSTDQQLENDVQNGSCFKADTLEDLALQLNMDPKILQETIRNYNNYVDNGYDEEFQKGAFNHKVEVAPFYATPRSPATHHTMGGLKIDEQTHVINKEGHVIHHLYAAGEVAGGIHAGNRLGGNALADIFVFGRKAGKMASNESYKQDAE
ncbi:MAG: FAD-dependent oxidoreductase [Tetragenococcus halophilus]|uniref:FAD-dependent oxidoreductase n=1 Tax=Tetragenococcus halophilus TaxID=51669 RepID=UPI001F3F39C5|nr:FAD-dependent oxidoreductase [Tetragenococcus halophilus]MDN6195143.1 FAD-dependent oxidoreductase [Atopostipes suicloacalis]MDN6268072.1 FAD-dependent oxidoreductase [Tetragenococcus koreensis]MDN6641105.1 FAD-dependent oxidoreductase [Tetragenococcus sp.]MCF1676623.1 FAD-dependent oxidoreductase [Tetragenococcus halophilus]MDN6153839.1 FAD-dependent oxidoreductase [Tetragenococcus halophilus]